MRSALATIAKSQKARSPNRLKRSRTGTMRLSRPGPTNVAAPEGFHEIGAAGETGETAETGETGAKTGGARWEPGARP